MDNLNNNAPDQELDNAFGITAPQSDQQQGESQPIGQPEETAPNGQPQPQAPETPTNDLGEQSAQEQAQEGQPDEITEEKKTNILQKFGNDRTKIAEGLVNIGKRLGKEVDMDKVSNLSEEEILAQYAEAEKELGTQGSQQQQPNNEVEQVKQQMQQLAQQNQAMRTMLQQAQQSNPQIPQAQRQRDPNTGQFVPQNQQETQQSDGYKTILNEMKFDDYDPDQYIEDETYHAKYMQNKFGELLSNLDKREQTKQKKTKQMQEQESQKQQAVKRVNGQILQIKQKMGDQAFNQSRRLAGSILQNNSHLLKFQGGVNPYTGQPEPSGVEIAFNQARQQLGLQSNANQQTDVSNQQQPQQPQQQQQQQTQQQQPQQQTNASNQQQLTQQQINNRQAAQMPKGNPRTPVQPANNKNREILDAFGLNP